MYYDVVYVLCSRGAKQGGLGGVSTPPDFEIKFLGGLVPLKLI